VNQTIQLPVKQIINIKEIEMKDKEQVEAIIKTMAKGKEVDMINIRGEKKGTSKDRGETTFHPKRLI
jgi:hypothetical protein